MGRMAGFGIIGRLADGTAVVNANGTPAAVTPSGLQPVNPALIQSPQSNAQAMSIPSQAGGGNVQGRGLVFQYQTPTIASLGNGASTTVTIQFDQNSVFNWLRTTISANLASDTFETTEKPMLTLQITDTGNGQSFMNAPIPVSAIAGSAQLPYVLPTPQFIQSNASYQFQWANYSGTGATATTYYNIRLQLQGYRIFNVGTPGTG
jgi:hypothetical protein